ncbi:MAG: efflux RND transporter periplasmic adaptor subunit [Gammaproteobacteria bacterium]|nr:efflux RND transporter periplasmic adaptor subunit [Gammaproteobacteria bacterium]
MRRNIVFLIGLVLLWQGSVQAVEYTGYTRLTPVIDLTTPVSGVIQQVNVRKGQLVKQGQALLTLDLATFNARVVACEAGIVAQTELRKEVQREYVRAQEMYEQTLLSERKLQLALIDKLAAEARYQRVNSDCVQARQTLKYAVIRAPMKGLITEVQARAGEVVSHLEQPRTLIQLVNAERMWIEIPVRGDVLDGLRLDQTLDVMLKKQSLKARVIQFEVVPDVLKDPYYRVTMEIKAGDVPVRAGYKVSVSIP